MNEVIMVRNPIALEQGRLVKRVRSGTAQPATYEGTEESSSTALIIPVPKTCETNGEPMSKLLNPSTNCQARRR